MKCPFCGRQESDTALRCSICGGDMAGVADPHKQAEALVREANLARVRGDFALAITRAQQAVELYGDDVFAHLLLGELFEQRRDWASALHHYEVALALKPDNVRAREKYALAEKRARSGAPAPKTARQAMAAMVTAPRPGREAAQPQDPDAAMRAADRSAAEFRSRLRLAFSRREKAEYLLARVAQERGHAGVPEDDLARLAAEYGAAREDGARRAMMLKREIANRLREVEALLQQVAHELSEIQEASARGEIDFTDADVRRSGARIRQQAATRTANALQELQRAQSAVDLGGVEMSVSLVGEIEADLPPDEPPPIVTEARPRWVLRGGAWLATGGAFLLALSVFMPWVTVRMPIPFGPTLMLPLSLHALAHPAQLVAATLGSAWDPASYDAAEFNAYTPWIVRWLWALVLLAGIGVMSAHMWRTVVWRLVHRLGALAVVGTLIYLGFRDMAAAGGLRPDAVNAGDFAATIAQIQPHVGFVLALVMAAASIGGAVWDFLVRAPLERDAPRMSALAVPRWALVAGLAVLVLAPGVWAVARFRPTPLRASLTAAFVSEADPGVGTVEPARIDVAVRNTSGQPLLLYTTTEPMAVEEGEQAPPLAYRVTAQTRLEGSATWTDVDPALLRLDRTDSGVAAQRTLAQGEQVSVAVYSFGRAPRPMDDRTDRVRVRVLDERGVRVAESTLSVTPPTVLVEPDIAAPAATTVAPLPGELDPRADLGRSRLRAIRNAIVRFYLDTATYPVRLEDLVAPDGASLSGATPPEVRRKYGGPYLSARGGMHGGIPRNPFVEAKDEDLTHHWHYNPDEKGQVVSAVRPEESWWTDGTASR